VETIIAEENQYHPAETIIEAGRRNVTVANTEHGNIINNIIPNTYCEGMYTNGNVDLQ
jgi:hypothetical protein